MVRGGFHIDHFVAVVNDPTLATEYDNLLYACSSCNLAKGAQALPNPLIEFTAALVHVEEDGTIHADGNAQAARLIELLGLDCPDYTEFRRLWIGIVTMAAQHAPALYQQLMSYPANLPNLRRYRPPDNIRPEGVDQSAYARRHRDELPPTY